ncbi:MAG: PQQ-binding-like beta-propeller repeat protein [Armatimonadia bacterium]|nr:PQQ-binding-like beta-propeller repeat protein [Armatimonadia bacterium]
MRACPPTTTSGSSARRAGCSGASGTGASHCRREADEWRPPMSRALCVCLVVAAIPPLAAHADWPAVRGDNQRSGLVADEPRGPFERLWIAEFEGEAITTRVEAVVADGVVVVGTMAGRLHALDAQTGEGSWSLDLDGPILHSPAVAEGRVFAASAGGEAVCADLQSGEVVWRTARVLYGFHASPMVEGDLVLIGGRDGTFRAYDADTGDERWSVATEGPIRTTAASADGRVFFASDDMHAYCAELLTGDLVWRSDKLPGQSLRDYYPVVLGDAVVLRSAPVTPMPHRIGDDAAMLCRNAGIENHWQAIEAHLYSDAVRVPPETHAAEQAAILDWLEERPHARTCFVLDADSGTEVARAPVLWMAGCQGVATPPVRGRDGRGLTLYRTAYSNFNLGVAPLVGLGWLDPQSWRIDPIYHSDGDRPPWNTFWGTADEAINFSIGGGTLFICHQGTLSALDLESGHLSHIVGDRDTWGGEPSVAWARNEWHGPARGSAAIDGDRLYWVTGSRVIAIQGEG